MAADNSYLEAVQNIATAIGGHACPNGCRSITSFCACPELTFQAQAREQAAERWNTRSTLAPEPAGTPAAA